MQGDFTLISVDVSLSAYGNKPMDELRRLIDLRVRRLGEAAKDAVAATFIEAIKSIRARTRVASTGRKPKQEIEELTQYRVSRLASGQLCLKPRGGHGEVRPEINIYFRTNGQRDKDLKVFRIVSEHERRAPYVIATDSRASAVRFDRKMAQRAIAQRAGLARTALGVAMAKISTRNEASPLRKIIEKSKIVIVTSTGQGADAIFSVKDNLGYATKALKGGAADVQLSLAKAANKISHVLVKHLNAHGDMALDLKTPFPEVSRKKVL